MVRKIGGSNANALLATPTGSSSSALSVSTPPSITQTATSRARWAGAVAFKYPDHDKHLNTAAKVHQHHSKFVAEMEREAGPAGALWAAGIGAWVNLADQIGHPFVYVDPAKATPSGSSLPRFSWRCKNYPVYCPKGSRWRTSSANYTAFGKLKWLYMAFDKGVSPASLQIAFDRSVSLAVTGPCSLQNNDPAAVSLLLSYVQLWRSKMSKDRKKSLDAACKTKQIPPGGVASLLPVVSAPTAFTIPPSYQAVCKMGEWVSCMHGWAEDTKTKKEKAKAYKDVFGDDFAVEGGLLHSSLCGV